MHDPPLSYYINLYGAGIHQPSLFTRNWLELPNLATVTMARQLTQTDSEMDSKDSNPLLKKLRRHDQLHKPTGRAAAFFGPNQKPKIMEITPSLIRYTDLDGKSHTINFNDCVHSSEQERGYIGKRGLLSCPPWIEFFDSQHTRFEFQSKTHATNLLMEELAKLNIKTIDMD